MPFGFRIAPDTLPSGIFSATGSRSALAVSGFRLRARLGFSIPVLRSRPARRYPRFRIRRSSSERRGDFNPHDSRAAQRTLWDNLSFTKGLAAGSFGWAQAARMRQSLIQISNTDGELICRILQEQVIAK